MEVEEKMECESTNKFEALREMEDEEELPPMVSASEDEMMIEEIEAEESGEDEETTKLFRMFPSKECFERTMKGGCEEEGCCARNGFSNAQRRKNRKRRYQKVSEEILVQAVEATKEEVTKKERKCMGLSFQVADVKKPLRAVKRITEKGNYVAFGQEPEDNYIYNKKSGDEMMLKSNGKGSFVMDVSFVGGEKEITVDSGAEENVCPWEWGKELFGTKDASTWMVFRNANGEP